MQVWECLSVPVCLLRKGRWALTHWIPHFQPPASSSASSSLSSSSYFFGPLCHWPFSWSQDTSSELDGITASQFPGTYTSSLMRMLFIKGRKAIQKNSLLALFFSGLASFFKRNYPREEEHTGCCESDNETQTHTPEDTNSSGSTTSAASPSANWEKNSETRRLYVVLCLCLSFTFSFPLGLLGDGVPKETSVAAAALKQTSKRVKPSTNTTLFAEQQ